MVGMWTLEEKLAATSAVAAGVLSGNVTHAIADARGWPMIWPTTVLAVVVFPGVAAILPSAVERLLRLWPEPERPHVCEVSKLAGSGRDSIDDERAEYAVWTTEVLTGGEWISLYDEDPQLEMTILGTAPTNERAKLLGGVGLDQMCPHVWDELQRRVDDGSLTTNVDLSTGKPLPGYLPPLEAVTEFLADGRMARRM